MLTLNQELYTSILEMKAVQLGLYVFKERGSGSHEQQGHSGDIPKESGKVCNSRHMQADTGHHRLVRAAHGFHLNTV